MEVACILGSECACVSFPYTYSVTLGGEMVREVVCLFVFFLGGGSAQHVNRLISADFLYSHVPLVIPVHS